ncbi:hypothetical protein GGG16DRAFT_100267 [Schizophyllum commune]
MRVGTSGSTQAGDSWDAACKRFLGYCEHFHQRDSTFTRSVLELISFEIEESVVGVIQEDVLNEQALGNGDLASRLVDMARSKLEWMPQGPRKAYSDVPADRTAFVADWLAAQPGVSGASANREPRIACRDRDEVASNSRPQPSQTSLKIAVFICWLADCVTLGMFGLGPLRSPDSFQCLRLVEEEHVLMPGDFEAQSRDRVRFLQTPAVRTISPAPSVEEVSPPDVDTLPPATALPPVPQSFSPSNPSTTHVAHSLTPHSPQPDLIIEHAILRSSRTPLLSIVHLDANDWYRAEGLTTQHVSMMMRFLSDRPPGLLCVRMRVRHDSHEQVDDMYLYTNMLWDDAWKGFERWCRGLAEERAANDFVRRVLTRAVALSTMGDGQEVKRFSAVVVSAIYRAGEHTSEHTPGYAPAYCSDLLLSVRFNDPHMYDE